MVSALSMCEGSDHVSTGKNNTCEQAAFDAWRKPKLASCDFRELDFLLEPETNHHFLPMQKKTSFSVCGSATLHTLVE